MKWTPILVGSLCLAAATACNGNRGDNNSSGTAGSGTESGTMRNGANGAAMDTSMSSGGGGGVGDTAAVRSDSATTSGSMRSGNTGAAAKAGATGGQSADTARLSGRRADSARGNQTKSGVTNTKTGKSTLGKGVMKTRPDQGQPVTSKGDTVRTGGDTTSGQ